jgi:hypothetical protein
MNPNFLVKDELQYELRIRGISSAGDTAVSRKLFRSVIPRQLTLQWDYLESVSVAEWCSCIEQKICELQKTVSQSSLAFVGP